MKTNSSLLKKIFLSGILGLIIYLHGAAQEKPEFPLKVSQNGHYLVCNDGKPFYFCGDTQWILFWYYTYEDAVKIIDDRVEKGFTTLLISTISWSNKDNQYGHKPITDKKTLAVDVKYYEHAERVMDYATEKGLAIYLVPLWFNQHGSADEEAYYRYGKWLGERWKNRNNLIWVIGGDTPYRSDDHKKYINLALGIKDGGAKQIMSWHPHGGSIPSTGRSSSEALHTESWLSFNSIQAHSDSGTEMMNAISQDYEKKPTKPVILIEQWYYWMKGQPMFNIHQGSYEIRKQHYFARLGGSFGEGYGAYPFWLGDKGWEAALNDQPAATQIGTYMGNLLKPLEWYNLVPDFSKEILISHTGSVANPMAIARTNDKKLAIIYFPVNGQATINLSWFANNVSARWYDPTNGKSTAGKIYKNSGNTNFQSPRLNSLNEWDYVLVLQAED